jgi:hypothetical protein
MAQFSSMFTPNRRIDYLRNLSRELMPEEIRAFDPNIRNHYAQGTGTNLANVLKGLAQTYFAQDPLRKADRLEAEQRAARGEIWGSLSQARRPRPGPYYETIPAPPAAAVRTTGGPARPPRGPTIRRLLDDGRAVSVDPVSAETAQAAGIDFARYKAMHDKARMEGDVATQEAIEGAAEKGFSEAIRSKNWPLAKQWQAIVAPEKAFERRVGREKEERKEIKRWTTDGQEVWIPTGVWRDDQALPKDEQQFAAKEPEKKDKTKVGFVHFVPHETFTIGDRTYEARKRYQVTQRDVINNAGLRDAIASLTQVVRPSEFEKLEILADAVPVVPVLSDEELVSMIREGSAGDFPGVFKTVVDSFRSFVTLDDYFPKTRKAKAALNQLRMIMRVPLVKSMSDKGGKFTIEQADTVLPGSDLGDAKNMARIKALIPDYKRTLLEAVYIKANQPLGSSYHVAATKVISSINSVLPLLERMDRAWDSRNKTTVGTGGSFKLPSGIVVKKLNPSTGPRAPVGE